MVGDSEQYAFFLRFSVNSNHCVKPGTNLDQLYESLQNALDLEMFLQYNGKGFATKLRKSEKKMYSRGTRRLLSILLIAVLLTAGMIPSAFASVPAKVKSSSARVYKSASTKAASVKVPKNLSVSITAISGSWARVTYKGNTAYMPLSWLTPTEKTTAYTTGTTTVYNSSLKKMSTISMGTSVYMLGTIGDYYLVMNKSGSLGYVKNGTLSKTKPAVSNVTQTTNISKADKAIALGESLLGKPYKSSSNPPSSFDCSSFVWYCMGKAGYSVYKTSATQAADSRYAKITSISSLKKGDMIFFDTSGDGKVDHSAIYMGGDKFIEASRNAGKVQINTMTNWYKSHFMWGRRPA